MSHQTVNQILFQPIYKPYVPVYKRKPEEPSNGFYKNIFQCCLGCAENSKRFSIVSSVVTIVPGVVGLPLTGVGLSVNNHVVTIVGGCLILVSFFSILHNGLRYCFCKRREDCC